MSEFKLPEFSADAHPEFTDEASCTAWLTELPLVNVTPSQIRLLDQLQELNRFNMPDGERLKVLEALREAVYFVQAEQIKNWPANRCRSPRSSAAFSATWWRCGRNC